MIGMAKEAKTILRRTRIGPAGWSYPDWAGIAYPTPKPRGFHEAAYLAEHFETIEINTSFCQPLRPDHCKQWIERTTQKEIITSSSRFPE